MYKIFDLVALSFIVAILSIALLVLAPIVILYYIRHRLRLIFDKSYVPYGRHDDDHTD